jgi:mRNA interferase HigB
MERVFSKNTLREFWNRYPDSEQYLKTWYDTVISSEWKSPNDIKNTFIHASILKTSRVVFNIKGNSYRIVAKLNYDKQWLFIRFIGTHQEYSKIDADTI